MSRWFRRIVLSLASAAAVSQGAIAQIVDHNDFASVTAISPPTVRLATGDEQGVAMSVRYVDKTGDPIPGLAVSFLVDECGTSGIGVTNCPPLSVYGHFNPPMTAPAVTDSNGVATGNPFAAGTVAGSYRVAAVAYSMDAANAPLQGDSMGLFFQIEQLPPGARVPISPAFTGAWYDPSQSGHGLLVEVLSSSRILAYWFTFDPDGRQAWFGGDGTINGDAAFIHAMQGNGGRWIPHFDPTEYQLVPWGELILTFADCNHGRVDFAGSADSSEWSVGHMDLTRLTIPAGVVCS
ncbi:MAG: hypothetical protein ABW186_08155 [Rhodanobacteraceae bacterium]